MNPYVFLFCLYLHAYITKQNWLPTKTASKEGVKPECWASETCTSAVSWWHFSQNHHFLNTVSSMFHMLSFQFINSQFTTFWLNHLTKLQLKHLPTRTVPNYSTWDPLQNAVPPNLWPSHRLAIDFLRLGAHVPGFIRSIGREAKELPVDLRPRPERQEMCGWQFFFATWIYICSSFANIATIYICIHCFHGSELEKIVKQAVFRSNSFIASWRGRDFDLWAQILDMDINGWSSLT